MFQFEDHVELGDVQVFVGPDDVQGQKRDHEAGQCHGDEKVEVHGSHGLQSVEGKQGHVESDQVPVRRLSSATGIVGGLETQLVLFQQALFEGLRVFRIVAGPEIEQF